MTASTAIATARLCEECGMLYLEARVAAKQALLLVSFNPTF